ncbi:MAG: hypothetical protein HDQ93_00655 [Desulfovibrio sp.]|nr:hypothetical protein [Desulfovibrio sp.]
MNAIDILHNLKPVEMDAGLGFSGNTSGAKVKDYAVPCQFTPKTNPDYIFHETSRDVSVWLLASPTPLYICGSAGCGKSSLIAQLAARLNYPVFEITGHNRLNFRIWESGAQSGTAT